VSWLLVACVPWLLMLATLGLGRLEKELAHDTVTATDVAEFLENAEAVDMHTLAREGMPEALECLHRRQAQRLTDSLSPDSHAGKHRAEPPFASEFADASETGLPTRIHKHSRVNPQFQQTRRVNHV
jgi:hypothetical protein